MNQHSTTHNQLFLLIQQSSSQTPSHKFYGLNFWGRQPRPSISYGVSHWRKVTFWLCWAGWHGQQPTCNLPQDRIVVGLILPVQQRTRAGSRNTQCLVSGQLICHDREMSTTHYFSTKKTNFRYNFNINKDHRILKISAVNDNTL